VLVDRHPAGVISLVNKADNAFTPADVALLLIFNQVAATVLQLLPTELKAPQPQQLDETLFGDT